MGEVLGMKVGYVDIETNYVGTHTPDNDLFFRDYKNHLLTVIGIRVVGPDTDQFTQLLEKNITKARLLETLWGVTRLVTYNGRSIPDDVKHRVGFDFPVIDAQLGVVLDREFPHTDLVPECWKKNLYGGLKKVEQALGLQRKLPGKHGAWAMETYRAYVKTGDKKSLEEFLAYNREDVFMLREVELRLAKM
jgi:uncharacterized protein YprB with RNaseH-like and TPR domain